MKAILVIDIDEIENCDAEVCVYKNDIPYQGFSRIKLKPMPEKMKVEYDRIATCEVTEKVVAIGWNACVDEILGEENAQDNS